MGQTPLVEMQNIHKRFGGVHAVNNVSIDLNPGEVVGLLGHNGAGKSVLMKTLSGAIPCDEGKIFIKGKEANIQSPRDARDYGIETIYQTLALAENLGAAGNLFLGREKLTRYRTLDEKLMADEAQKVISRLNPNFTNFKTLVKHLSGGQRQAIAISRAIYFNAKILIMDEPTAALGPHETAMVADLIKQLKKEGIGIFLVSHDMHDVFDLSDRITVIKNGSLVGTQHTTEVTKDEVLGMIIMGKLPEA